MRLQYNHGKVVLYTVESEIFYRDPDSYVILKIMSPYPTTELLANKKSVNISLKVDVKISNISLNKFSYIVPVIRYLVT
jgi:hypothetical protein